MRGTHRWPVNSTHKWPVTRNMFPLDNVSWVTPTTGGTGVCCKIEYLPQTHHKIKSPEISFTQNIHFSSQICFEKLYIARRCYCLADANDISAGSLLPSPVQNFETIWQLQAIRFGEMRFHENSVMARLARTPISDHTFQCQTAGLSAN